MVSRYIRSVFRGRNQGEFYPVLGPGEASTRVGSGLESGGEIQGSVIEACYSAMGLLSAGGWLPQAEKSRDPGARLPPPPVYDPTERDRNNVGSQHQVIGIKIRSAKDLCTKATYKVSGAQACAWLLVR